MRNAGFVYHKDLIPHLSGSCFIGKVRADVGSKEELLRELASVFLFPEYFGNNWDSLLDCLSDLSWFSAEKVVLIHFDLPLAANEKLCQQYLQVLNDCCDRWRARDIMDFLVAFPDNSDELLVKSMQPY